MTTQKRRSTKQSKIIIVDDHPLVRERLAELINHESDLKVCAQAEDCRSALAAIASTKPDLALIDLTLKDSHGLDLLKDIRSEYPAMRTIIVSMHDESLYAERVMRAGANGYITKQEASGKILEAIRLVLAGQLYISHQVTAQILGKLTARRSILPGNEEQDLTDRELQVYEGIGLGHSTRQVADELRLDVKTVETYRARIKEKFNLKDGSELLRRATRWIQSRPQ